MSEMLAAVDESAALEQLHEIRCTDGLPVVIPTEPRVARMVLASGFDAEMVLGEMGPAGGVATMEKVAAIGGWSKRYSVVVRSHEQSARATTAT